MRVKICGITSVDDAQFAAAAGADYVGMVFAASARRVSESAARAIVTGLPPNCVAVAVVRNATFSHLSEWLDDSKPGAVQFHGDESPELMRRVRDAWPSISIIRAVQPAAIADIERCAADIDAAQRAGARIDIVLVDAPKGAAHPGFGVLRSAARQLGRFGMPIWLAGGLTPENVIGAIDDAKIDGVDVASGVEASPGKKNPERMKRFIEAAKSIRHAKPGA